MESTKDQARPKLSARSKKTTQIQARSVKRNASDGSLVWMGGADVSLLDFCSIAFYKQRRMEGGTALPDLLSFFYSPDRRPAGRTWLTHPAQWWWEVLLGLYFSFSGVSFSNIIVSYINASLSFSNQPPHPSGDVLQLCSSAEFIYSKVDGFH